MQPTEEGASQQLTEAAREEGGNGADNGQQLSEAATENGTDAAEAGPELLETAAENGASGGGAGQQLLEAATDPLRQLLESTTSDLTPLEELFARVVPVYGESRWLQLLAISVASALLAWLVALFVDRVVAKLAGRPMTDVDDKLGAAGRWPMRVSLFLIGLGIGLHRLGLGEDESQLVVSLLLTIALLFWTIGGLRVSATLLRALARQRRKRGLVSEHTEPLFENLAKVGIVIWRMDVSGLLAAGGILGLTIGFAARDTLANLFAGIFIFADRPYKIGDFVTLDSG